MQSRRDFLKVFGGLIVAAVTTSTATPVTAAISYSTENQLRKEARKEYDSLQEPFNPVSIFNYNVWLDTMGNPDNLPRICPYAIDIFNTDIKDRIEFLETIETIKPFPTKKQINARVILNQNMRKVFRHPEKAYNILIEEERQDLRGYLEFFNKYADTPKSKEKDSDSDELKYRRLRFTRLKQQIQEPFDFKIDFKNPSLAERAIIYYAINCIQMYEEERDIISFPRPVLPIKDIEDNIHDYPRQPPKNPSFPDFFKLD